MADVSCSVLIERLRAQLKAQDIEGATSSVTELEAAVSRLDTVATFGELVQAGASATLEQSKQCHAQTVVIQRWDDQQEKLAALLARLAAAEEAQAAAAASAATVKAEAKRDKVAIIKAGLSNPWIVALIVGVVVALLGRFGIAVDPSVLQPPPVLPVTEQQAPAHVPAPTEPAP